MTGARRCARRWPSPSMGGRCSPASPGRRSRPPGTASWTPPPTERRSPAGSPATRTGTSPSRPAPRARTCWTSTSTARPGTGSPPSTSCAAPGCWKAPAPMSRTPSGGLHAYFTGTSQRNGHLPGQHLDFRSAGGYVLVPPSRSTESPTSCSGPRAAAAGSTGPQSPGCSSPRTAPAPARRDKPRTGTLADWPPGSPARRRETATRACSGPPTAPWRPTTPPT